MDGRVHDDGLAKDECGKPVKVDRVDVAVDDQVARYTEQNQEVHAGIKNDGWQKMRREATKSGGSEGAGGDQEQAAMENDSASVALKWSIRKRAIVTAVEIPSTEIITPSATPNQPILRCNPTLLVRTSVDWRI